MLRSHMPCLLRQLASALPCQAASCSIGIQPLVRCMLGSNIISTTSRQYSTEQQDRPSASTSSSSTDSVGNEKVRKLAEDITSLTVLECSWLTEILRKKLNMQRPAFGGMAMPFAPGMMGQSPQGPPTAAAAPAAPPPEEKKEKTEFDVKLDSYSPEGKIKVIKEVRAVTSLGLKEAKELVEKAPVVIKAGVSKGDAEALKKQLEAAGGKISLE